MCLILFEKRFNKLSKVFINRFCHNLNHNKTKVNNRSKTKKSSDYSKTVLLPKSTFPPKHSRSLEIKINFDLLVEEFAKLVDKRSPKGTFVLHDGPPYANGSLHFGHAINKFLKDIICRRKLLEGFEVSFLPGWDCHGLPIELKAISGDFKSLNPLEIRQKAKQLALNVIEEQKKCLKSWRIIADWNDPYLTFDTNYIITQINAFNTLLDKGLVFRDHMPVYWSPSAQTALAEAELQYNEQHVSKSVFLKYKLTQIPTNFEKFKDISALVWTTTPWTLPANQAIAYSSRIDYSVVKINRLCDEFLLVANDLIPDLERSLESKVEIKQVINGSDLKGIGYKNPISLNDEILPFLDSSHVTTTKGTGLVHIAPNHGLDDYNLILKNNIPVKKCIVDERGCYDSTSNPLLDNKSVLSEGNEVVINLLGNSLLFKQDFIHSYPYDWRTNEPVIVRASHQWFLDIEPIRMDCVEALKSVQFFPQLYKQYLINQLNVRPNWCISRQRSWGVPIPVLYRKDDLDFKTPIISKPIINEITKQMKEKGCDVWFESSVDQLVPKHIIESELKLSSNDLIKGKDIFDIWFDSGNSWNAALTDPKIADMYLEGYDQLRGWFQSSLIVSVALRNCAPFRAVKIHGFALDSDGKKMSKSLGNVIDPNDVIEKNTNVSNCGSDGFRWWVSKHASDHKDEKVSIDNFDDTLVNINRIRITLRFLIGSLNDFDAKDVSDLSEMNILDKYLLNILHKYLNDIEFCYETYDFTSIITKSLQFIVNNVSAFYLTRVKHRLYCEHKTSLRRKSCQTVLYYLYNSIVYQLAPILPHIMIEANNHLPINKDFIRNNKDWNQMDVNEDMKLILSIIECINKAFIGKKLINFDAFINTSDNDCLKTLSLFQLTSSSSDSDLCEMLGMSSVKYSACDEPQRDGITLNGCHNQMNYQLLITSANHYLCDRCRRYTSLHLNQPCDQCLQVLAIN